jgi:hypothetical protein
MEAAGAGVKARALLRAGRPVLASLVLLLFGFAGRPQFFRPATSS